MSDKTDTEQKVAGVKKGSGTFLGNVLAMSGGATIVQGLAILASPIISRLFLPEAFGIAAIYVSIAAMISTIGCLRYERAIMLPKRDEDSANVFGLCFLLIAGIITLVALVVALWGEPILSLLNAEHLMPYRWVIPLGAFLLCATLPLTYWNNRHKQFKRVASVQIAGAAAGVAATLIAGFIGWRSGSNLIIARMVGLFVVLALMARLWWRHDAGFVLRNYTTGTTWRLAKRYKKFPLVDSWTGLLDVASKATVPLLLAGFFDTTTAGLYALSRRVLAIPIGLVSSAVGQVFFQRAAADKADGRKLGGLVENVYGRLIALGALPTAIVAVIGPDLFGFVFGNKWTEAGFYARALTPWLFLLFVSSPLTVLYPVLERQGFNLLTLIMLFAARIGALMYGGLVARDAMLALWLFSGISVPIMLGRDLFLIRATKARPWAILGHVGVHLGYAAPWVLLLAYLKWVAHVPSIVLVTVAILSAGPYGFLVLRRDEYLRAAFLKTTGKVRQWLRW